MKTCTPTPSGWTLMKRLLRYPEGVPRVVLPFGYPPKPKTLVTWTDGDSAVCATSLITTSAGVMLYGAHLIKSWSTN